MEEAMSLIFHGFKLVKDLEANLPNVAACPDILRCSCQEIVGVFKIAGERLRALEASLVMEQTRVSQAMDLALQEEGHHGGLPESGSPLQVETNEPGGRGKVVPLAEEAEASIGLPLPRPRRRDESGRRTVRVPAPRMGNTELPPEDGYTWRKYGQKEILGSRFPRGYFRCTYQKLCACRAKKQVQRLDSDPFTFEVTYRGVHTCTLSFTVPSIPPPPLPPPPAEIPTAHWLSMDVRQPAEDMSHSFNYDSQNYGGDSGGGDRLARYGEYHGLADLVEAMFNPGNGTTNNSMELIFPSMENKWEGGGGDKK